MIEVLVFSPLYHRLFREREKDHSGLIKSLVDLGLACLAKSPPVYCSCPGAVGSRKPHKVLSKWPDLNYKCRDAWKMKEAF